MSQFVYVNRSLLLRAVSVQCEVTTFIPTKGPLDTGWLSLGSSSVGPIRCTVPSKLIPPLTPMQINAVRIRSRRSYTDASIYLPQSDLDLVDLEIVIDQLLTLFLLWEISTAVITSRNPRRGTLELQFLRSEVAIPSIEERIYFHIQAEA